MSLGPQITFALITRPLADGQAAIVLHLYRAKRRALSTTLTTCTARSVPETLETCRSHLEKLGISAGPPRLPMVSGLLCQALMTPNRAAAVHSPA